MQLGKPEAANFWVAVYKASNNCHQQSSSSAKHVWAACARRAAKSAAAAQAGSRRRRLRNLTDWRSVSPTPRCCSVFPAQVPLPSMTLSQIFDTAGLHIAPPDTSMPPGTVLEVQQVPPSLGPGALGIAAASLGQPSLHHSLGLPSSLGMAPGGLRQPAGMGHPGSLAPPASAAPAALAMHPHAALLPAGLSPAGPFAGNSISLPMEVSLNPAGGLGAPASMGPPSMHPSGGGASGGGSAAAAAAAAAMPPPPRQPAAAAARAARARKRKDAPGSGSGDEKAAKAVAGPLSAAEAARQAKLVAERAAAELAELPQDLDEKEARAIKRAVSTLAVALGLLPFASSRSCVPSHAGMLLRGARGPQVEHRVGPATGLPHHALATQAIARAVCCRCWPPLAGDAHPGHTTLHCVRTGHGLGPPSRRAGPLLLASRAAAPCGRCARVGTPSSTPLPHHIRLLPHTTPHHTTLPRPGADQEPRERGAVARQAPRVHRHTGAAGARPSH